MAVRLQTMTPADWPRVRVIYEEGLATGEASFETAAPGWPEWDAAHLQSCRLVARDGGEVVGWAALSPVTDRCAYAGVAEVSVCVAAAARGRGVGKALLTGLVEASERAGIWTLQAGIFPENRASIAVHEAAGFRRVGVRERLGKLAGAWRDVELLERRSDVAGVD